MSRRSACFSQALPADPEPPLPVSPPRPARKLTPAAQLRQVTRRLAATEKRLLGEFKRRESLQQQLAVAAKHSRQLLRESERVHRQMQELARRTLLAQEQDRRSISRQLHDEIAQTLAGIHVQLSNLQAASSVNLRGLRRRISATQRLVAISVDTVHRFARDLRPAVLDDLGLVPALRSFLRTLPNRKALRIQFSAFLQVENLTSLQRTALYRVAQEAITNVNRHARATRATITIQKVKEEVVLIISDNGRSFRPDRIFNARNPKHLGLLGMRERMEMVGGTLTILSTVGTGTVVRATLPLRHPSKP